MTQRPPRARHAVIVCRPCFLALRGAENAVDLGCQYTTVIVPVDQCDIIAMHASYGPCYGCGYTSR